MRVLFEVRKNGEKKRKQVRIKLIKSINYLKNAAGHFRTITEHKMTVMNECFSVGLYRQGLLHALSKYSPEEFRTGVLYYQGTRSPNNAEREATGKSLAWLHHKGRNKHHFEYWIDFGPNIEEGMKGGEMPLRYVIEMAMDRIAACKTYQGDNYTDESPYRYYSRRKEYMVIHPKTRHELEVILKMLAEKGEDYTFAFIRALLRREFVREADERRRMAEEFFRGKK